MKHSDVKSSLLKFVVNFDINLFRSYMCLDNNNILICFSNIDGGVWKELSDLISFGEIRDARALKISELSGRFTNVVSFPALLVIETCDGAVNVS